MSEEAQSVELPPIGTPEYNEAMVKKYDQGFSTDAESNQQNFNQPTEINPMPEGGLEKFYNKDDGAYDWPNHVKELNYRLDQTKATPTDNTEKPAEKSNALDWEGLSKAVSNGGLKDTDYQALQDFGIPKDVVDSYVDLLDVGQEFQQQRTIEYAGGAESLNGIFDWAKNNLNEEEIKNYNDILDSPNWRMALDSLKVASGINSEAPQASDNSPQLVEGQTASDSGTGFASREQMIEAMRDARYKNDPAYRNNVRLRIGRSNF